jgi:glycosyltransferase involved in cell wall biosynthesis
VTRPRLAVLDTHQPWVRGLVDALPDTVDVTGLQTMSGLRRRAPGERSVRVPGWTLFPRLSARLAARHVRADALMLTLPHYAGVADRLPDLPVIYHKSDPYEEYEGWDRSSVVRNENRLLARCRLAFAVSEGLAADLRPRTCAPVFVLPNGVPAERLTDLPAPARPADLPPGPVAVCVGHVTKALDFDLIAGVADRLPGWTLAFVGEVHRSTGQLADRANVRFLGHREPQALPAYLHHAHVLFSPLAATAANDRRSLLRIYDYLTTDRPVIATPIASCRDHAAHIDLAATVDEFAAGITAGRARSTLAARRAYLADHTWAARAGQLLSRLAEVIPAFAEAAGRVS